ncbi:MAG: diguanylate cyclase [Sulfurimonas sp.]|nr:diguanylate cyclase [Sulfurimonas sp.]
MKMSTAINISIIIFLIIATILINYSLTSFANAITVSASIDDKVFEYSVVFFIYFACILLILRVEVYLLFINPITKIKKYIHSLKHKNDGNNNKKSLSCIGKEFKDLVELIECLDKELQELSMTFETSVKENTQELALSNEKLNEEKEFAHKIIDKLSDIVFVIKDNSLVNANNNFYKRFKNLESFLECSGHSKFVQCLEKCESCKEYLKVDAQLFSVNIELFNENYYIVTLIDMTAYNESIKYAQDQNPLTKLPGNESIKKYMYSLLKLKEPAVIIYFDFDNFKPFNDKYGFELGDRMISSFADILKAKECTYNVFNAHIGGDDFFCSIKEPSDTAISMVKDVINSFTLNAKQFYSKEDINNNCVMLKDREGNEKSFPLLSVSAVVVNIAPNSQQITYIELTKIIASMKKVSKMSENKLAAVSVIAYAEYCSKE